ncbi:MAG: nucleotidyltransferase family protein [Bacteroidetes bacterium]|nr:nucleotidyltransferase family protein [Bacteroidota bacterium]
MNQKENIISTLKKLKPELTKRFFVNSIGVFGSAVRNDFSDTNSDIDIIVDFHKPIGIEFVDLAAYLESKFNRRIDLVSRRGIKPKYFEQIQSEVTYV